jgi:hypothetical protein
MLLARLQSKQPGRALRDRAALESHEKQKNEKEKVNFEKKNDTAAPHSPRTFSSCIFESEIKIR